ncbi:MAG: bacillithiol biosynthesis cysteine-adding enzyme BshC [Ignavibacteriaceae bacterium]
MFVNFSQIPATSKLFLDFLYNFNNVKPFYTHNFREKELFPVVFNQNRKIDSIRREKIYDILKNQYQDTNTSKKTQTNIELLKNPNTLAVVTGQQLGLFGGPLYTLYKTITVIKLCNSLSEEFDSYNFVPVFWMESEDHDLEEITSLTLPDEAGNPKQINYLDPQSASENRQSVGDLQLGGEIEAFLKTYRESMRTTDFSEFQFSILSEAYKSDSNYLQAFRKLMISLFDSYGVILFNPNDKDAKEMLKPLFLQEINDFRKHTEALVNVSATLDDHYHAQVKVKPVNLFMQYDGGRYLIEPVEEGFRLKNKRVKFTKEELLGKIDSTPELFSPNVLMRPVCQDYLFPTAFYVGGPGEIAYFAQALTLYDFFKVNKPVLYPRASVTLVERSINSLLTKYNLKFTELLLSKDKLTEKIINTLTGSGIDETFNDSKEKIDKILEKIRSDFVEIDPQLADMSAKYKQKIFSYLDEYKAKAAEAQKRKYDVVIKQSQKALNNLYPDSVLQERAFNYFYFANKYGADLLSIIYNETEIEKFEHQLIML